MLYRAVLLALAFGLLASPVAWGADAAGHPTQAGFAGHTLTAALKILQDRGLPVVFSSRVVKSSFRVEVEPRAGSPREILDEILRPHHLRVHEGIKGRLVVVPAPPPRTAAPQKPAAETAPLAAVRDEILVTPGTAGDEPDPAAALTLDPADAAALPHLGDDVFRALTMLPGATATEASSQVSVRGGRDDEVLVVLDGLELLAPYHLQELDSALSIVAPGSVGKVELSTGGYPAQYGDRMSGVIDMTTLDPSSTRRFTLGLGLVFGEASASGGLAGDRGRWSLGARAGNYHLPLEVHGREENPQYGDAFGKLEMSLLSGQTLQANVLAAEDLIRLAQHGERYGGRWGNRYLWLTHGAVVGSYAFVESIGSVGRVDRDRRGSSDGEVFSVTDRRRFDLAGLKQVWSFTSGPRASLAAGFEVRELHAAIDYLAEHEVAAPQVGEAGFAGTFDYTQTGAFVSSRWRPFSSLSTELGVRWDRDGATGESHLSPRASLAWAPRQGDLVRLAWGWYHQSQRPNELQVEDGETELARAERAEHRIVGWEHRTRGGATLRLEAYQRRLGAVRVRYENLFDPAVLFPELSRDRVRLAPDRGLAQGFELFWRGADRGPWSWWTTYALSSIEDEIDGRKVPRSLDQTHALTAGVSYRSPREWTWNAAWVYHTGWPTTRVSGRLVVEADGTSRLEPVLGPLHAERFPPSHRLDLRVSRAWKLVHGELDTYVEIYNLYDRENLRGFRDFAFDLGPEGDVRVRSETVSWGGFLPSFGLRWRF